MFKLYKKLQNVKGALIRRRKSVTSAARKIQEARNQSQQVKMQLSSHPQSKSLFEAEKEAWIKLTNATLIEESMIKQKAREQHLNLGDSNTKVFPFYSQD